MGKVLRKIITPAMVLLLFVAFMPLSLSVPMNATEPESATADPIKVLVIDWMSDPLLRIFNTLANASFDTSLGLWVAQDTDLLNGLDYWDTTSYRKYSGSGSAWCAQVGSKGIPPFDTPNKDTHTYDDNMHAFLQTFISLIGRSSASLSYYYWIKSEPSYDWLAVQVSTDAIPVTWVTLPNSNYTGDSGGWKYATTSLDPFCGNATVWIRFLFHSNGANHDYEGAYVDEVKVIASSFPFLDNSIEKAFWNSLDADPNFDVTIRPPAIVDITASIVAGQLVMTSSIINYIEEIQPDVIVLDDLCLDMFDLWGLNKTERLALFNYIEQGHGLILTYGSLFDMRVNATYVGPYGHVNRLYLEQNPSIEDLRDNYRSSLAAASGLGLLPIYEEAREQIANLVSEMGGEGEALAFIMRSAPLLPIGIPFNGTFTAENASDPILEGMGGSFAVDLASKGVYANGTLVGWQLEYPFLMASRSIDRAKQLMDQTKHVVKGVLLQIISNTSSGISGIIGYSFPSLDVATSQIDTILDNSTETMTNFLVSLYKARLSTPSKLTIPIHFTIGKITIDENITVQIPVEIQEIVKPATIVAESPDGLAAILRYEVGKHRAVYFTFKPSLGGDTCLTLMKNALEWASETPTPRLMTLIANLGVPTALVNSSRDLLHIPAGASAKWNTSDIINKEKAYSYSIDLEKADSVIFYWYGYPAKVNASLGDTTLIATNITMADSRAAIISYVPEGGTWVLRIRLEDDDPLLTPLAIETYSDDVSPSIWEVEHSPEHPKHKENVTVAANVTDQQSGVKNVTLWFRISGGEWHPLKMTLKDGVWTATIPGQSGGTTIEFYVESHDNAENRATTQTYSYIVKVAEAAPLGIPLEILIWIIVGIAVLVGIAIYLVKFRRK